MLPCGLVWPQFSGSMHSIDPYKKAQQDVKREDYHVC